jgi:hypothetical protein
VEVTSFNNHIVIFDRSLMKFGGQPWGGPLPAKMEVGDNSRNYEFFE